MCEWRGKQARGEYIVAAQRVQNACGAERFVTVEDHACHSRSGWFSRNGSNRLRTKPSSR